MTDGVFLLDWRCPRCRCNTFTAGEVRVSGSGLGALFNVEGKRFRTAECNDCGYTEFYKRTTSAPFKVLDYLLGR